MKLSEKIYLYRKQSGKSQEQLAELMGVSRQAVSKWETGDAEPENSKLLLLAEHMGVTIDCLLCDEKDLPAAYSSPEKKTNPLQRLFSGISWTYPIYLIMLFLTASILICFDPYSEIIHFSNLLSFVEWSALFTMLLCCLLLLFACELVKPFIQALGWMFCKRKRKSSTVCPSLSRKAIHTAMGGCILGNLLYQNISSYTLFFRIELEASSLMMAVKSLLISGFLPIFYSLMAILVLIPISISLKKYIK